MEEPSVLDYLKSKLNPWATNKVEIPESEPALEPERPKRDWTRPLTQVPWFPLLAVILAVAGQRLLEPPTPQPLMAFALYLFAFAFLALAFLRSQWQLPALTEEIPSIDPQAARNWALGVSAFLAFAAFFTFGGEKFTPFEPFMQTRFNTLNVVLWLGSILAYLYALWLTPSDQPGLLQRAKTLFQAEAWTLQITRWTLLLALVFGIVAFYRFYDIRGVPAEPFSDQAEKLMDVADLVGGQTWIFFERNTGREFFQMYLTAFVAWLFGDGLTFFSLKLGTVLAGFFTLPYLYLLGKELAGPRVALLALFIAGVAYWPNVISRVGLRFPLYPLFAAPVLFYLVRGLRTQNRNDFILAGLFLGLGLHGYSPFRFVPFVVLAAVGLYLLHKRQAALVKQTALLLAILVLASMLVFLPLMRYTLERPDQFAYRAMTRLGELERPLPAPEWCQSDIKAVVAACIFLDNLRNSMLMMNWQNGDIWVHSVPGRPALDIVSGAFFIFGYLLLLVRYIQRRDWRDIFLLLAVPLLMMPSILSLAFPGENPSLNRSGGAYIIVFIVIALALDGLYESLRRAATGRMLAVGFVGFLLLWVSLQNYALVFEKYSTQFRYSAWNTSDMGRIVQSFTEAGNRRENAWVIAYPYWVDTRLVGVSLGDPYYNPVVWPDELPNTLDVPGNKLFMVKYDDTESLQALRQIYPQGLLSLFEAAPDLEGKDFWVFYVPASQDPALVPAP
jgi:hypothetical protein